MIRVNLVLLFVAVLSALGVVTAEHRARGLVVDFETQQQVAQQLDEEWRQLQTEQSTYAMLPHIESVATKRLRMQVPAGGQVQMVDGPVRTASHP